MVFGRAAARLFLVVVGFGIATPLSLPRVAVAAEPGQSAALISHAAEYDMQLASVRSSSGIVGAGGTMSYSFTDTCDGWAVETRTDLTMLQTQGGPVRTAWDFLSWESKDGTSYRFRVRNRRNGEVVEAYDGEARMAPGGAGTAVFHLPGQDEMVFDLDKGTLFPTAHTLALLRQAAGDTRFFSAPVFDGSSVKGAFTVTAAIGKRIGADVTHVLANPLLDAPAWPMVLAFFPPDGDSNFPDFEVRIDYHANGVAENLLQDFGDFTLRGTLKDLKTLAPPKC